MSIQLAEPAERGPGFNMPRRLKPTVSSKTLKTKPSLPKRQTARELLELQHLMA
jgi:hypothetical protein